MWDDQTWVAVEQAIDAMQHAWRRGTTLPFEDVLPPPGDGRREAVLVTLIKVDQEHGWTAGQRRLVEAYLAEWPELADKPEMLVELLRAECRTRRASGERPTREELATRFPWLTPPDDDDANAHSVFRKGNAELVLCTSFFGSIRAGVQPSATEPSRTLSPGARLGRYRLKAVLGRGGMGTVYLAEDEELHRPVAIKVLHPWIFLDSQLGEILLDEARAAAGLKHASLVPVYDVGRRNDGSYFFVMEYVEGDSLAERIAAGPIAHDQAVVWTEQLAEALDVAHRQGFVHRDVKPSNVLVDREGRARLADFGLALRHDEGPHGGEPSGTLPYMAPEQIRGQSEQLGPHTDVWALGVVLYEMMTGRRPFEGAGRDELKRAILEEEPAAPRAVRRATARDTERVCMRCLQKAPSARYPGAAVLAAELRESRRRRARRSVLRRIALAAIVVAAALAGGFAIAGRGDSRPPAERARARLAKEGPQMVAPWLVPAKLVLVADTAGEVDLAAAEKFVRADPGEMMPVRLISYNASRAEVVGESTKIENGWLRWEMALSMNWSTDPNASHCGPRTTSLRLRFAVNGRGQFQLGTVGDRPEEHLAVLVPRGGIRNHEEFGGRRLARDKFGEPHNEYLDTDERQNLLATWFMDVYLSFYNNRLLHNGPANKSGLYDCPLEIRNFFPRPVTVVCGRIYHQRFDDRYSPNAFPEWEKRANGVWSPAAMDPDRNVRLGFSVAMRCESGVPSALYLEANTDNRNSSTFRAEGLSLDDEELDLVEGARSFIKLDKQRGVCEGGHTHLCGALVLLCGQSPTHIALEAKSNWSIVQPSFRYATLGEVEILDCQSVPEGLATRRIEPQVWTIPPQQLPPSGEAEKKKEAEDVAEPRIKH